MFNWIVKRINISMSTTGVDDLHSSVGILDILASRYSKPIASSNCALTIVTKNYNNISMRTLLNQKKRYMSVKVYLLNILTIRITKMFWTCGKNPKVYWFY